MENTPLLVKGSEVIIGTNKLSIDSNNILHVFAGKTFPGEDAIRIREMIMVYFANNKSKIKVLVDLNGSGKPSHEAREVLKELNFHPRVEKVAMFGLNEVARVIASFFIVFSKSKNTKFFKDKEEALRWFNENQK